MFILFFNTYENFISTELSDKQLEYAEKLCKELLSLGDILDPGLSRFRGSILYDLQAVQVVQIKRQFENEKITKDKAQVGYEYWKITDEF